MINNDKLEEDLKRNMKGVAEQQLKEYRKRFVDQLKENSIQREKIITGYHNFKLQLITLAGGTISVFIALQGTNNITFLIKLGFSLLGISLLCGIISIFFSLVGDEEMTALREEFNLSSGSLDMIEKFGGVDVSIDKMMQKHQEEFIRTEKERLNNRYGNITRLLKIIHIDTQKIEDGQLIFFLSGIILIVFGLFI